jgi:hypothetical protein
MPVIMTSWKSPFPTKYETHDNLALRGDLIVERNFANGPLDSEDSARKGSCRRGYASSNCVS